MPNIYLISPERIENIDEFALKIEEIFALEEKPAFFQLRLKGVPDREIENAILKFLPICEKYGVRFVINDNIKLALKYQIGLHVGTDDASFEACVLFKQMGGGHLGVSCYNSIVRAKEFENIADCISFGAMFLSKTKQNSRQCSIEIIKDYAKHNPSKQIAIIGGIDTKTIEMLEEILPIISCICVISCVWND